MSNQENIAAVECRRERGQLIPVPLRRMDVQFKYKRLLVAEGGELTAQTGGKDHENYGLRFATGETDQTFSPASSIYASKKITETVMQTR